MTATTMVSDLALDPRTGEVVAAMPVSTPQHLAETVAAAKTAKAPAAKTTTTSTAAEGRAAKATATRTRAPRRRTMPSATPGGTPAPITMCCTDSTH